jgi:histidinol-phosphate/aromatic aminotransferase/cobyric acid decarboxylase-like protein
MGCGSTEILRVAACAFLGNGREMIQALATFEALEEYAKSVGSEVVSLHLTSKFAHDLAGMLAGGPFDRADIHLQPEQSHRVP